MSRDEIINEYFEWLFDLVCGKRYSDQISYRKLLMCLHDIEFIYIIPRDRNRAEDGIDLRYRFALEYGFDDEPDCLDGPCSVLEMIIALSLRCEETIMEDVSIGNRTGQWFWGMLTNLGLGSMYDGRFDERYVKDVLTIFMNREYAPDGKGGLFTIKECDRDLRTVEIWHQLCWYLETIA